VIKPIAIRDILQRKWSRGLIKQILGEPVGEMTNPHFSTWPKMKFYDFDQVVQAEADPRWIRYQPLREKRSIAGRKAAATRARKRKELTNDH
jgi:hypothetical protein